MSSLDYQEKDFQQKGSWEESHPSWLHESLSEPTFSFSRKAQVSQQIGF